MRGWRDLQVITCLDKICPSSCRPWCQGANVPSMGKHHTASSDLICTVLEYERRKKEKRERREGPPREEVVEQNIRCINSDPLLRGYYWHDSALDRPLIFHLSVS